MEKRDGELVNVYLYEFCHIVVGLEMENGEFFGKGGWRWGALS
jgi:hypothetical protein